VDARRHPADAQGQPAVAARADARPANELFRLGALFLPRRPAHRLPRGAARLPALRGAADPLRGLRAHGGLHPLSRAASSATRSGPTSTRPSFASRSRGPRSTRSCAPGRRTSPSRRRE
jgi:hypothetical protein